MGKRVKGVIMSRRKFQYYKNCTEFTMKNVHHLNKMVDDAKEIKPETFFKHVSKKFVEELLGYDKCIFSITDDWAVSYYSSKIFNNKCYYVRWSSIEYIFI